MSHQKIAQLTAQLKNLPPTSPAAKALSAALVQAKAPLSTVAVSAPLAPVDPVEVPTPPPSPLSVPEVMPAPPEAAIVVTAPSPIYQAIGLLEAELCQTEDGWYCLQWQGKLWRSALRPALLQRAPLLLGQRRYWRVYPHVQMSEQGFIVDRFMIIGQPPQVTTRLDGEFLLSGCWQSLPQWQGSAMRPSYFSVYANAHSTQIKPVLCRNYPLNWPDQPTFEPNSEQSAPWHSIVASLQTDGSFEYVRLLAGPAPAPPRLILSSAPPAPLRPPPIALPKPIKARCSAVSSNLRQSRSAIPFWA
jgi:hypothetical protein